MWPTCAAEGVPLSLLPPLCPCPAVRLNGKLLPAGSTLPIKGGSLKFAAMKARQPLAGWVAEHTGSLTHACRTCNGCRAALPSVAPALASARLWPSSDLCSASNSCRCSLHTPPAATLSQTAGGQGACGHPEARPLPHNCVCAAALCGSGRARSTVSCCCCVHTSLVCMRTRCVLAAVRRRIPPRSHAELVGVGHRPSVPCLLLPLKDALPPMHLPSNSVPAGWTFQCGTVACQITSSAACWAAHFRTSPNRRRSSRSA